MDRQAAGRYLYPEEKLHILLSADYRYYHKHPPFPLLMVLLKKMTIRHLIFKVTSFIFLGFIFFQHNIAYASVQIRVSILQGAGAIKISAPGGLKIGVGGLEMVSKKPAGSIDIENRSGALTINKKEVSGELVSIMPVEGDELIVNSRRYRGVIEIKKRGEGLLVINELDIEDYLKGVVPIEVSALWSMEALKTQAVASRTYALYQRRANINKDYHLVSTVMDQAYNGRDAEDPRTSRAVSATDGIVLKYNGDLVLALFHSTSSGSTEDASNLWSIDLPYLKGVECLSDQASPFYEWKRNIGVLEFESALRNGGYNIGSFANITPYLWTKSSRVMGLRIIHSGGELLLRGEDLRRLIGYSRLPSTNFEINEIGKEISFSGKGAGHGVGLCQWGTKEMAEMGFRYQEILRYYFPGTEIVRYDSMR